MALSYRGASLIVLLEAGTVLAVLTLTVMGSQLPADLLWWRIDPAALFIAMVWVTGLALVNRAAGACPGTRTANRPTPRNIPAGTRRRPPSAGRGTAA